MIKVTRIIVFLISLFFQAYASEDINNYKMTLYDGKLPYNKLINFEAENLEKQESNIRRESWQPGILKMPKEPDSDMLLPLRAAFSGLAIDKKHSAVSLSTREIMTNWGRLLVSILVFEGINQDGNEVLEARCFMPKSDSKKENDSHKGSVFTYRYEKILGNIEKMELNNQGAAL